MWVRIKSGNEAGAVVDQPQAEAEANIATGFAEPAEDPNKKHEKDTEEKHEKPAKKK